MSSLMDVEAAVRAVEASAEEIPQRVSALTVNPTLVELARPDGTTLVWRDPWSGEVRQAAAGAAELVVLEMARSSITEEEAAAAAAPDGEVTPDQVAILVDRVVDMGLVLAPPPGLHRDPDDFPLPADAPRSMVSTRKFVLQWHLTNACDLHCAHCYDRNKLKVLRLEESLSILESFAAFCRRHRMHGEATLSGGNPLFYPWFMELYEAVASKGMTISILGNPVDRHTLESLCAIQKPDHFQVSLEGLREQNDRIRGEGYFDRVMSFLPLLRELDIESGVMLTLTKANMAEVLPLGQVLAGKADCFTFNRLAQVGEGAALAIPGPEEYARFLAEYEAAAMENPVLRFKDNLFNIDRNREGEHLLAGCTGYGCGAAFNFMAVLPDGEAHACRKFPSPIGNVLELGVEGIWQSEAARSYRAGCSACHDCEIRLHCGGCLAVSHGAGLDPLTDRDPHCFIDLPKT